MNILGPDEFHIRDQSHRSSRHQRQFPSVITCSSDIPSQCRLISVTAKLTEQQALATYFAWFRPRICPCGKHCRRYLKYSLKLVLLQACKINSTKHLLRQKGLRPNMPTMIHLQNLASLPCGGQQANDGPSDLVAMIIFTCQQKCLPSTYLTELRRA